MPENSQTSWVALKVKSLVLSFRFVMCPSELLDILLSVIVNPLNKAPAGSCGGANSGSLLQGCI